MMVGFDGLLGTASYDYISTTESGTRCKCTGDARVRGPHDCISTDYACPYSLIVYTQLTKNHQGTLEPNPYLDPKSM